MALHEKSSITKKLHGKQILKSDDLQANSTRALNDNDFSRQDLAFLASLQQLKKFDKGTMLIRQGDVVDREFTVIEGCVRTYQIIDGHDITLDFHVDGEGVMPAIASKDRLSQCFIVCELASTLSIVTYQAELEAFEKYPTLKDICREQTEMMLLAQQEELLWLKRSKPEQRLKKFMQDRGKLFDIVPHYHIASYLGIAPESLSRLRKKIKSDI